MKLHFDRARVLELLQHSIDAAQRQANFEQRCDPQYRKPDAPERQWAEEEDIDATKIPPGLWLVGDEGIYLMSNGKEHPKDAMTGKNAVVYAEECNPAMDPDKWWYVKQTSFGGDDGCDFLDALSIQNACDATAPDPRMWIDVKPNSIRMPILQPVAPKPTPKRKKKGG